MKHRASPFACLGLLAACSAGTEAAPQTTGGGDSAPGSPADAQVAVAPPVHDASSATPPLADAQPAADAAAVDDASAAASTDAAPVPAEAAPMPVDAAPPSYVCNLVLGIKETGEWFNAGFEKVVVDARWEVVPIHDGHIELWADPNNAMWSIAPSSACTNNPRMPDRVIFVGTNYDYATVDEFVPKYLAVIDNIKAKYPSVRRVELMTYVRGPGNVPCPGNLSVKTYIKAAQDQAIDMVAQQSGGFVVAAPKFEVKSCSDFAPPPHFTPAAAMAAAQEIGAYYATH